MKRFLYLQRIIALLSLLLIFQAMTAQSVNVNLNVLPPYSPYFKDYAGFGGSKVIVTLTYSNPASGAPADVFLTASITKDDGSVSISVKDSYRPSMPIQLMSNVPRTLTGAQLREIFAGGSTGDLNFTGISKESVLTDQALPEGTYNVCVKVRDYRSGRMLSTDCRSIFVTHAEPPQIIPFINNEVTATNPQFVNIQWTAVSPFLQGTSYRLRLVKLIPGVTPHDALQYSAQVVLEKSGLMITNFPVDLASGVKLETGTTYVAQVTATAPTAFIKNSGKSEPVVFTYKAPGFGTTRLFADASDFKFLNPRDFKSKSQADTVRVNNENNMLISWAWTKKEKDSLVLNDLAQIEALNLNKYILTIRRVSDQRTIVERTFGKDAKNKIPGYLEMPEAEATHAGFIDGERYIATIDMMDTDEKLYKSFNSNNFIYKRLLDEDAKTDVRLNAVLKYEFKDFPETYPVSNTEVTIKTFMKSTQSQSSPYLRMKPVVKIEGRQLIELASHTIKTDQMGTIKDSIQIPQKYIGLDTLFFKLEIHNNYYVDEEFKLMAVPPVISDWEVVYDPETQKTDSTYIGNRSELALEFGELKAKTYAYRLKLKVEKKYGTYSLTKVDNELVSELESHEKDAYLGGYSADIDREISKYHFSPEGSNPVPGIPVVLYRENKQEHIPHYEGNIPKDQMRATGKAITAVAIGRTKMEGGQSYAVFEKLLASNNKGEEYKILAISDLDEWIKTGKQGDASATDLMLAENAVRNLLNSGSGKSSFIENNEFVASVQPFRLKLPEKNDPNKFYRTIEADYEIISAKPPTSVIQGRLTYAWPSEQHVKRPLTNTHFRVIVDYVDSSNKSIGNVYFTGKLNLDFSSSVYFTSDEDPDNWVLLNDQYAPMGQGKTDADGNFMIEFVNYNEKGSLGSGDIVYQSSSSRTQPIAIKSIEEIIQNKRRGDDIINPADAYSHITNPGDDLTHLDRMSGLGYVQAQTGHVTTPVQSGINANFTVSFDALSGSFNLGKNLGAGFGKIGKNQSAAQDEINLLMSHNSMEGNFRSGPNPTPALLPEPEPSGSSNKNESVKNVKNLRRVLRIVIDGEPGQSYYPSKDVIEVQPFENRTTPFEITHYVREYKLDLSLKEIIDNEKKPVTDLQTTIFRDPESRKNKTLPQSEGDGQYTLAELLNPEYTTRTGAESTTSKVDASSVYSQKFEHVWSKKISNKETFTLNRLVQSQYKNYFIQSSSLVDQTNKSYQSTIAEMPKHEFDISDVNWSNPGVPGVKAELIVKPLASRALISVRDGVSSKLLTSDYYSRVIVELPKTFPDPGYKVNKMVDKYGYAEIIFNKSPYNSWFKSEENSTDIYFYARANGYKQSHKEKRSLRKKGSQATINFPLDPAGRITGKIVAKNISDPGQQTSQSGGSSNYYTISTSYNAISATTKPVPAYLQVDSGKIFETDENGQFNIAVPLVKESQFKIIPKDVGYFSDTLTISEADSKKTVLAIGNHEIFRRKHRIQLVVREKPSTPGILGPPAIKGARVKLGDVQLTSDDKGVVRFEFENVSVNNYTLIVEGPPNMGYIPKTLNIKSEETKEFITSSIELEKGSEVSGIVALDGVPVKNAKVYLDISNSFNFSSMNFVLSGTETDNESGSTTDDANLVVAYSDSQGHYTLRGVPVDNQALNIRATIDTTFTVSGDVKEIFIENGHAKADLELKSYKDMVINKVFGFPLTVENITPVNSKEVKVTGIVHWNESLSDFKLNEVTKAVRIEETVFKLSKVDGVNIGVPKNNEVKLSGISSLKLSYLNKYNIQLTSSEGGSNSNVPLKLVKENDYGKISGKMKIVDNSFNYPNTYLNFEESEFYLAKLQNGTKVNNIVHVFSSAMSVTESNKKEYNNLPDYIGQLQNILANYKPAAEIFHLSDAQGKPVKFKLIRFNATADPLKSYLDREGKIHLKADVKCHIPNAQPENFSFTISDMVLDQNEVYPATGSDPLRLKLEKWDLEVSDWSFSVEEGGILSNNAVIKTQLLEVPVKQFVLRSDMFHMDKMELKNLTLAGGKFNLKVYENITPQLNYEYKIGSDMKPHWNLSLISSKTVGSLQNIKGLTMDGSSTPYSVEFDYIQILSNDEMLVQLKPKPQKANLKLNSMAKFEPQGIFAGEDYISIYGLLNVGAPRMGGIILNAYWDSPNQDPTFGNVTTDFEGKGFVHFTASQDKISINDKLITIEGKVVEKPVKSFNAIPSTFFARKNAAPKYEVMMQKGWVTQLTEEESNSSAPTSSTNGYSLKIEAGGMRVLGSDWTTCTFEGLMTANGESRENINNSYTKFEVLGDVKANTDSLGITDIDTGFGTMSQVFDFKNKRLLGTLRLKPNLWLGSLKIHQGVIETCIDPQGFYVAGGSYAFVPAGILSGDYNVGFMLGNYPLTDHLWGITNSYIDKRVINECYKKNTAKLSGIYTAFNREIINEKHNFNFIVAGGYVKAVALIGGDLYLNVSGKKWVLGGSGYLFVDVGAGLWSLTGTSISGGFRGDGQIKFQVGDPSFFNAHLGLSFNATVKQYLVLGTVSTSVDVDCQLKAGTDGFKFSLNSGGDSLGCD